MIAVLESLDHPEDVLVKDQISFSQYFNGLGIWAGSLQNLGFTSMCQFKGTQNDTITLLGHPIDSDTVDIPINVGWNWIGSLTFMEASNGYLLKSSTAGNLSQEEDGVQVELASLASNSGRVVAGIRSNEWEVNSSEYEHSMTLVGVVEADELNVLVLKRRR